MDGLRSLGDYYMDGPASLERRPETPSTAGPLVPTNPMVLNVQGVTNNDGSLNIAGRDNNINNVNNYYTYTTAQQGARIIAALRKVPNLRKVHLDTLAKATPGTGIWLFKTDQWLLWLDLNGKIHVLWGTGIPGAGKSVLASIVIRELEARAAEAGGNICVAYVFIRYSDAADMTIRGFLEVLVKQTVERHADCAAIAAQVYARHMAEDTEPTEAELVVLLEKCISIKLVTFYIIDALDEAPDRLQLELVKKLASLNARLFITSRPLRTVEARAGDAHRFSIAAQGQDLDIHIAQGIERSPDLQVVLEQHPSLREEVICSVKKNCGGMFLHASLQLDALCQSVSLQDVVDTLDSFPSSINDVYLQTWNRIHGQNSKLVALAKAVLIWVINASRSLTLKQLEWAVAAPFATSKFEPGRIVSGATLLSLCRGLVVLEEKSRIVRLVHYTAKDVLERLLNDSFLSPHSLLAKVCMVRLSACNFQNTTITSKQGLEAILRDDALLAYAWKAWAFHARLSLDNWDARRGTSVFIAGCRAFPALVDHELDILQPLHVLAQGNLPLSLLGHAVGNPNVTTRIGRFTPLALASRYGHAAFVRELLEQPDVQPNATDIRGWSSLITTAFYGFEEVAALLLSHSKTDVNLMDQSGDSALAWAAWKGRKGVIIVLLSQKGIDVNLANRSGETPLLQAVQNGREGSVKLLLAHPCVNVNPVNWEGKSALSTAAERGNEAIVKLFLARDNVDINLVDNHGDTALMLAAEYGHESIVRLLVDDPRLDISIRSYHNGSTALSLAMAGGFDGIAKLLELRRCEDGALGRVLRPSADPFPDFAEIWMAWEDRQNEGEEEEETFDSEGSEAFEDAEEWLDI